MLVTLTGLRVKPNRALFHTIDMHTLLVRYRHSKQMRKYIYDFKTGSSPISTPSLQGVKGKYPLPPPPTSYLDRNCGRGNTYRMESVLLWLR